MNVKGNAILNNTLASSDNNNDTHVKILMSGL